jgi:hypothetical protein
LLPRESRRRHGKIAHFCDSHVFEPGDLWSKALGHRFGDAVPRALATFAGQDGSFFYVGRPDEAAKMDELVDANAKDRRLKISRERVAIPFTG